MGREGLAVYQDDLPTPASFAALVRVLGFVVTARMPCPLCDNCRLIASGPTGSVRNNTGSRRDATAMGYTAHQVGAEHGKRIVGVYLGAQDSTQCKVPELHQSHMKVVRVPPSAPG
jgi:hypothetical protein